jgi:hypothetical protein
LEDEQLEQHASLTPAERLAVLAARTLSTDGTRVVLRWYDDRPQLRRRPADAVVSELADTLEGGIDELAQLLLGLRSDRWPGSRANLEIVFTPAGVNALHNASGSRRFAGAARAPTLDGQPVAGLTIAELGRRLADGRQQNDGQ